MSITTNTTKEKGAGGANTNKNGLSFEKETNLSIEELANGIDNMTIKSNKFIKISKKNYKNYSNKIKCTDVCHIGHGCKQPDEFLIEPINKIIVILEKKKQTGPGSVCEKIQTYPFKLYQYKKLYPNYKVYYVYCLSNWFKTNCKAELEWLNELGATVLWGDNKTYKNELLDFLNRL